MEVSGVIQPSTWDDALELCAGRVIEMTEEGVRHPAHKDGAALSVLRSEFDLRMREVYGKEISFPSVELFDWWTGFTIMCVQAADWLLAGFDDFSFQDSLDVTGQYRYVTGGSHLSRLGHDAVLVHTDYALESLEGVCLHSSDFTLQEEVTPGVLYQWTANEAMELARWALTGMMVAWDCWDLPLREKEIEDAE